MAQNQSIWKVTISRRGQLSSDGKWVSMLGLAQDAGEAGDQALKKARRDAAEETDKALLYASGIEFIGNREF